MRILNSQSMNPEQVEILGYLAAIITTCSFAPQVIKVVRSKHTKDVSLWMYIVITIGLALWLYYGLLLDNGPIIWANTLTIAQCLIILVYKIRYK